MNGLRVGKGSRALLNERLTKKAHKGCTEKAVAEATHKNTVNRIAHTPRNHFPDVIVVEVVEVVGVFEVVRFNSET